MSIFLKEIITVRDIDWEKLQDYFIIPTSMKEIDHTKIKLKNKKLLQSTLQSDLFEQLL